MDDTEWIFCYFKPPIYAATPKEVLPLNNKKTDWLPPHALQIRTGTATALFFLTHSFLKCNKVGYYFPRPSNKGIHMQYIQQPE